MAGRLVIPVAEPVLDANGEPDSGATLTIYRNRTTALAGIYTDISLTTPALNPQVADASGRLFQQATMLWADNALYSAKLTRTDGSTTTFQDMPVLSPVEGGALNPNVIDGGIYSAASIVIDGGSFTSSTPVSAGAILGRL